MTLIRLPLTVLALAACHAALAQAPAAAPAPASNLITQAAGAVMPATSDIPPAPEAQPETPAPRLLQGNDQVVARPKAAAPIQGSPASFNFEEAPVAEVVRTILGDILKTDYVLHPPLNGSVTLATRAPIPPDQAMFLLESALQANGLALMRDARGTYHVGRPDALKAIGGSVRYAGSDAPLPPGYGAIVVPLRYIGAAEMAAILRPMVQPDAIVRVDTVRNLLVMAGTRTQAEGWMDMINMFDIDLLKGMSVGVFPLKYVSTKEVETALRLVGGGGGSDAGAAAAPAGRTSTTPATGAGARGAGASAAPASSMLGEANPLFGALRIMPIERLNSILVVTPRAAYLEEARRWIEKLDQPGDNGAEPQLFIYHVQNVNARHLASVLGGIFGGTAGAASIANSGVAPGLQTATGASGGGYPIGGGAWNPFGNAGNTGYGALGSNALGTRMGGGFQSAGSAFGRQAGQQTGLNGGQQQAQMVGTSIGSIRVMADDLNNSVLVWSTRGEYERIEATLKRLDVRPAQVLIEASIVEVSLNDDLKYGLQWAFSDSRANSGYTGLGRLSGSDVPDALAAAGAGFSYTLRNSLGNVRAILSALSTKTSVKVVASPSLMVLDNHPASIAVGTQTPIKASTTYVGENVTNNIQYKDTGVNLLVTPSVNAGNIVTIEIDQSVTDVGARDEVTEQRAFLQRQLTSKVAVRSGESIVMGGLIQERGTSTKSGVPLLHTLPVVGNLFGNTANDGTRTELIVVITPRVVRSDLDIREVSEDLRDRMKGLLRVEALERGGAAQPPAVPGVLQPNLPQ